MKHSLLGLLRSRESLMVRVPHCLSSLAGAVLADSGPSNATVLDVCEAAGCPASDASAPRGEVSGAEFYGWTLPQLFEESFPPVTVTIAGDAALSGSLVTPEDGGRCRDPGRSHLCGHGRVHSLHRRVGLWGRDLGELHRGGR